jgi:universal stress protein E
VKKIKRILVLVSPKLAYEDSIERATEIANMNDASITLMNVVSEYPKDMSEWWNVRNPKQLHDQIVKEKTDFLEGIAEQLRASGVERVECEIRWGRRFQEVIREVVEKKHDLVMITPRLKHRVAKALMECPSRDLANYCPCTLWLSTGTLRKRVKRVLAAVEWKSADGGCDTMNAKILRTAAGVAETDGSELHIVHSLPLYGGKGRSGEELESDIADYMEKVRADMLERCLPRLRDVDVTVSDEHVHLLVGKPGDTLPAFIEEMDFDVVVVGTVARTGGIRGMILGSTAEQLSEQLPCAVVMVKPDDFESWVVQEDEMLKAERQARGASD